MSFSNASGIVCAVITTQFDKVKTHLEHQPWEFWEHPAMTHMHASRVSSFIICMYSTYCTYYHCLLQSTVLYVHTSAHAKGILFMPKVSSFMLRTESVRIKPLQTLPTVCTISLTPKGEHHIRSTLLPRPVLHLILVNFADNLVRLCFFPFKSAF